MSDTESQQPAAPQTFATLGLDRRLFKAIARLGFVYPSAVQSRCIPHALEGRDVLVRAPTGSGKTVAYAVPLIQVLLQRKEAAIQANEEHKGTWVNDVM